MLQKRKEIFLLILDVSLAYFNSIHKMTKKLSIIVVHWEHQGKFLQSSHNNEEFLAIQHLEAAICR